MGDKFEWGRKNMKASIRKNDILLIAGLLVVAGVLALVLALSRRDGRMVVIRYGSEVRGQYALSETLIVPIENGQGGENILHIEKGVVWMEEANCPDKLCVQQGKIKYAGESIICLPNAVVVEISGNDELALDGVTN